MVFLGNEKDFPGQLDLGLGDYKRVRSGEGQGHDMIQRPLDDKAL